MTSSDDDRRRREVQAILDEEPPDTITTRRILIAVAVLAVAIVVVSQVAFREPLQFREIPPRLIGLWTCEDPVRSDWYVDFARESITFGRGGTSRLKCSVVGLNSERIGEVDHYTVHYRDMAKKKHVMEILLDDSGTEIRLTSEPGVIWRKYED